MPSLISRLRRRAALASTTGIPVSVPPAQAQPNVPFPVLPPLAPVQAYVSPLERRIHPDLESLAAEISAEQEQSTSTSYFGARGKRDGSSLTALSPPSRRLSAGATVMPRQVSHQSLIHSRSENTFAGMEMSQADFDTPSPLAENIEPTGSQTATRRLLSRMSRLASVSPGEWSTFGRTPDPHPGVRMDDFVGHSSGPSSLRQSVLTSDNGSRKSPVIDHKKWKGRGIGGTRGREATFGAGEESVASSTNSLALSNPYFETPPAPSHQSEAFSSSPSHPQTPEESIYTSSSPSQPHSSMSVSQSLQHDIDVAIQHPTTPKVIETERSAYPQQKPTSKSPHTFGYPTPPSNNTTYPAFDSPHTFGYPTPTRALQLRSGVGFDSSPSSLFPSTSHYGHESSPPPPLPPLNHPELTASRTRLSQSQAHFMNLPMNDHMKMKTSTPKYRLDMHPMNTYPPSRGHSREPSAILDSTTDQENKRPRTHLSLPSTFSRKVKFPRRRAQDLFEGPRRSSGKLSSSRSRSQSQSRSQKNETPARSRSRTRTRRHSITASLSNTFHRRNKSQTTASFTTDSRRSSADWNAQQAGKIVGGLGERYDEWSNSWQAQVSREILRMSFGGGIGATATSENVDISGNQLPQVSRIASLDSPFLLRDNIPQLSTHPDYDLFDSKRRSHSRSSAKNTERKGKAVTTMLRHDPQDDTKDNSDIGRGKGKGKGKGKAKVRGRGTPSSPKATASISKALEDAGPHVPGPSSTLLQAPILSFTSATPDVSPGTKSRRSASEPTSGKTLPGQSSVSKGKRKAEDVEGTPPDSKKEMQRATFAKDPRPLRHSGNSLSSAYAPSSYHRKRARLSATATSPPTDSRPGSVLKPTTADYDSAGNPTSSWSSRSQNSTAHPPHTPSRAASRAASARSIDTPNNHHHHHHKGPSRSASRRSMSQVSIPVSAFLSPHAPSVSRSSMFHMRDPRKPPKKQPTPWTLRFPVDGEPGSGSPIHAWFFFIGFVLFPLWWIAAFWRTPRTRKLGGEDAEKAVELDDPQVEHDAKSWRLRCRVMAVLSFFTYIPFIVLVAIFAPR